MQMLYDSENFVVVAHSPPDGEEEQGEVEHVVPSKYGYELVDKRSNLTLYLHGPWAQVFYRQMQAWRENTPEQSEVENLLDQYTSLATVPLALH